MMIDRKKLKSAVINGKIEWQRHALERLMERGISREAIKNVLLSGEVIEDCEDYFPYPGALIFGWYKKDPLHVVVALDHDNAQCYIITAYVPDLEHFEPDFKTRREK